MPPVFDLAVDGAEQGCCGCQLHRPLLMLAFQTEGLIVVLRPEFVGWEGCVTLRKRPLL